MSHQETQPENVQVNEKAVLNKRLEGIGWGLFLIMLGGFGLVPNKVVPKGLRSIGLGVIMRLLTFGGLGEKLL